MSTENEPNQTGSPSNGGDEGPKNQDAAAKDAAAQALEQAKHKMVEGMEVLKKQDSRTQIYLGGLAVTVLCSLIFNYVSVTVKLVSPGSRLPFNLA